MIFQKANISGMVQPTLEPSIKPSKQRFITVITATIQMLSELLSNDALNNLLNSTAHNCFYPAPIPPIDQKGITALKFHYH